MDNGIRSLTARRNDGSEFSFAGHEGPILVVNTASKCGFTPQYKGLEELHKRYSGKGLLVVAFPCDQFAHQEPGNDEDIKGFCERNFGVTFPIMSKIDVNGPSTHPVFAWLKQRARGGLGKRIKWNFTKFLVERDGVTVHRYAPTTEPEELAADIEKALA